LSTTPCSVCHVWHNAYPFITHQTTLTDHKDRGLGSVTGFGTISAQQETNGTLVNRNLHANESVSASSNQCSNAEITTQNTIKLAVKQKQQAQKIHDVGTLRSTHSLPGVQ
jgi:hypothetical protein